MHLYPVLLLLLALEHNVTGSGPIDSGITVTSSSVHETWTPDKVADGDATRAPNSCNCCAATKHDYDPWYRVDLGKVYNIRRVEVLGRGGQNDGGNGYGHTLKNMKVTYGVNNSSENVMFADTPDVYVYNYTLPTPQLGRYMELKLVETRQYFVICELYVYAECGDRTYGSTCESCGRCLNNLPCDKDYGVCQSCAAGYKGDRCDQECSPGEYGPDCSKVCGKCKNGESCDKVNGSCTECQQGYQGTTCNECLDYKFGENCNRTCNCASVPCNKTTGICPPGGCGKGYKGTKCDTGCGHGKYGSNCNETCGKCYKNITCDGSTGSCVYCAPGFKDDKCKEYCSTGKYGQNCSLSCGNCRNGVTCDPKTGTCKTGCSDGYIDTHCETTCPDGSFGENCTLKCGNCSEGDVCKFDNGHCLRGCEPGLQPPTCLQECNDGKYGQNCSGECGHCKHGEACDKRNGTCYKCQENYDPPFCNVTVNLQGPDTPSGEAIGPIVGAVIGLLVAVLVIGVVIYCRRRHNSALKDNFTDNPNGIATGCKPTNTTIATEPIAAVKNNRRNDNEPRATTSASEDDSSDIYYTFLAKKTDLKICQLWDYIYLKKKEKCGMFFQEYAQIENGLKHPHDDAMKPKNRELNRYRGICAYDHSRVRLEVENETETDYINACFINGFERPRKFIASQGPTKNMKNDFWRMMWQQKSKFIVMVTNLNELGKEKCVLYWPKDKGTEVTFGNITVVLVSEDTTTSDYTIRHMEIFKDNKEEKLAFTHYHFQAWPDKSTPDSTWSLVKFWRMVTEHVTSADEIRPIVVHCSAGIGRTGSYIALDVAYHKARSEGTVKVRDVVKTLREQRVNMVQTQEQYVYIHEALADAFLFGTHYVWSNQFEEVYDYLKQPMDGIQTTRLETQFNFIKEGIADRQAIQASTEENDNIYNNVFNQKRLFASGEDYRPKSKSMKYVQEVGALVLPNHEEKGTFIISRSPEKSRMVEFWSLVQEQNVRTIVSMTASPESVSKRASVLGVGDSLIKDKFELTILEERKTSTYTERKFCLKDKERQDVNVTHFEFNDWGTNENIPKDAGSMLELIEAVMNCQRQFSETEPILVYCKNGFQHCGLACVLLSEINRMNREGSQINIIHTVKTMKERHADIIGTFDQYQYIYDVILEHVHDSTYQNQ